MSLDYASDHLTAAVRSLATSEEQLAERSADRLERARPDGLDETVLDPRSPARVQGPVAALHRSV